MIQVKRAYKAADSKDGTRYLIDALWPRGMKKDALNIAGWLKEVAPSKELRQWFAHDPARWNEFKRRYFAELRKRPASWRPLLEAAGSGKVTLVFGARDAEHNNAVALKQFLEERV